MTAVAPTPPSDRAAWTYRMKDLCEASGLQRQAIHFYIKEGLLPPGRKTSPNMAYYGPIHLERLALIQKLQNERFLPLRAIKTVLVGGGEEFTEPQRRWLQDVKGHVAQTLARGADHAETMPVAPLLSAHGVTGDELAQLDALGVVPVHVDADGTRIIARDDAWVFALVGELRAAGFTAEMGFGIGEMAVYERVVSELVDAEKAILSTRLTQFDPAQAARMAERVLPLVHRFIAQYHAAMIRRFFAAMT